MKNKYTNLNSYFESAKQFKSPVSIDKARCLVENRDLKANGSNSFFSKKGVRIMTFSSIIISALMIVSINLGVFNNVENLSTSTETSQDTPSQNNDYQIKQSENKAVAKKINKEMPLLAENTKSNETNIETTEITSSDSKIQGLNVITLTEEELNNFGIFYDSTIIKNINEPSIGYFYRIGAKILASTEYASGGGSSHSYDSVSTANESKIIKVAPTFISNFEGKQLLRNYGIIGTNPNVVEFIPFASKFFRLISMEFNPKYFPDKLPNNVLVRFNSLENFLNEFDKNQIIKKELNDNINDDIEYLLNYFDKINGLDTLKNSDVQLTPADSNMNMVIQLFLDHEPNLQDLQYKESKAKLGIKVVFSKHPIRLLNYIKNNFKSLYEIIDKTDDRVSNYMLANNLISIKVPFKNDSSKKGFYFWFNPSLELIDALPERYRRGLSKEYKLLQIEEAVCGAVIDEEKLYLDVWRACSGAIEHLRVFPNPVQNNLNIKFELKEERMIKYALHDLSGNKLLDLPSNQKTNVGSNSISLDLSKVNSGMYLLVVSSEKGEKAVQRLIKE